MFNGFSFYSTTSEHGTDGVGTPRHAPSIQRIRALFGEKGEEPGISPGSTSLTALTQACHPESLREGWLHCKVTAVEGKVKLIIHARQAFFCQLNSNSMPKAVNSNILPFLQFLNLRSHV